MEKQENENNNIVQLLQLTPKIISQSQANTSYQKLYKQSIQINRKVKHQSIIQQLSKADIFFNPLNDSNQFSLQLINHTLNYQAITVKVTMGPFQTIMNIHNNSSDSKIHGLLSLSGSCGNVYLIQEEYDKYDLQIAIKCIPFQLNQEQQINKNNTILVTIKEYFISKIASALKVGSKIVKFQQYDLTIYNHCIQFSMEKCLHIEEIQQDIPLDESQIKILKKGLKILHTINIVHCDIKMQNIAYSKSYKRYVFIDFGLSRVLPKGLGFTFRTTFVGNIENCCPQMYSLYISKMEGMVDLYYNDAHSIKNIEVISQTRQTQNPIQEVLKIVHGEDGYFQSTKITYYLYTKQFNSAINLLIKQDLCKIHNILSFTASLIPNQNLRDLYHKFLSREWQQSINYADLNYFYRYSHHSKDTFYRYLHTRQIQNRQEQGNQSFEEQQSFLLQILDKNFSLFELYNLTITSNIHLPPLTPQKNEKQQKFDFILKTINFIRYRYYKNDVEEFQKNQKIFQAFIQFHHLSLSNDKSSKNISNIIKILQYLCQYCMELPFNQWKKHNFRRIISQLLMIKKISLTQFIGYLKQLSALQCNQKDRLEMLHHFSYAMMFQNIIWGYLIQSAFSHQFQLKQFTSICQTMLVKTTTLQNSVKFICYFLLKCIIILDIGQTITNFYDLANQKQANSKFLKYSKILYYKQNEQYQKCRLEINKLQSLHQAPLQLCPEFFMLVQIYKHLKNPLKSNRIKRSIGFIFNNQNIFNIIFDKNGLNQNIKQFNWRTLKKQQEKVYQKLFYLINKYQKIQKIDEIRYIQELDHYFQNNVQLINFFTILTKIWRQNNKHFLNNPKNKTLLHVQNEIFIKQQQKQQQYNLNFNFIQLINKQQLKFSYKFLKQNILYFNILKYKNQNKSQQMMQFIKQKILQGSSNIRQNYRIKCIIQIYSYYCYCKRKSNSFHQITTKIVMGHLITFSLEHWIESTSFVYYFQYSFFYQNQNDFVTFLLTISAFLDIHPVQKYVNSYIRALINSFSKDIDLVRLDKILKLIEFDGFQWKYSFIAFFILQAMNKISSILTHKQFTQYLIKISLFLPYISWQNKEWILQKYYKLIYEKSQGKRYKKYLLKMNRKLMNIKAFFINGKYSLKYINTYDVQRANQYIFDDRIKPSNFMTLRQSKKMKMTSSANRNEKQRMFQNKLKKYHENIGNNKLCNCFKYYKDVMKINKNQD